uniref:Putative secreted protein n=1 Tax=Ixodes ricinus TaxID=34613 RepID=A0A147BKF8_IXORI
MCMIGGALCLVLFSCRHGSARLLCSVRHTCHSYFLHRERMLHGLVMSEGRRVESKHLKVEGAEREGEKHPNIVPCRR